jgi:hypothetical protein
VTVARPEEMSYAQRLALTRLGARALVVDEEGAIYAETRDGFYRVDVLGEVDRFE